MPRSNSPFLDVAIDAPSVKILDHGFIRVVDYCGDEEFLIKLQKLDVSR